MSNFHKDLDNSNLHQAKGFVSGAAGSAPFKNEVGDQTFEKGVPLPPAINFVDGALAPPTVVDGDIYVLIDTGGGALHSDWSNSGTTATYGDWARVTSAVWNLIKPVVGDLCFNKTAIELNKWNGTAWVSAGGGVTDGDKGDITVSSSGTVWTIDNDTVDNAKAANMATQTIKGRTTAGTGDPEDLTAAQVRAILNVADGANNYVHPNHSGDVDSLGDGVQTAQPAIITGKPTATVATTDLLLIADVSDSNSLKQVTAQSIADLASNLYTADGTLSGSRTVTMGGNTLLFSGGQTTFRGNGSTSGTTSLLVQNSLSANIFECRDDKRVSFNGAVFGTIFNIQAQNPRDGLRLVSSTGASRVFLGTDSDGGLLQLTDSGGVTDVVTFNNGAYAHDFIATGKRLGVNTTVPNTIFEVKAIAARDGIRLISSTGVARSLLGTDTDGGFLQLSNTAGTTDVVSFNNGAYAYDFVNTSKNFGIGIATPTAKLHVVGSTLLNGNLGVFGTTPIAQPTTGIAAATFVANTSGIADDTATFDGYTIGQVVKALRNLGILA